MKPMLWQRERDEMMKRVRPGTAHTATLKKAVEQCFDFADAAARERRSLAIDMNLNQPKRRDALGRFINGDLYQPLANALNPVAKLRAEVQAQKAEIKYGGVPRDLADLSNDLAAVEAALYFAKREAKDATDVSEYDLDALLTGPGQ